MLGFTATRAIVIDWLFYPIASQLGLRHKQSVRFAEQGWLLVYYLAFWAYGMVSYLTTKNPFFFFSLIVVPANGTRTSGIILATGTISVLYGPTGLPERLAAASNCTVSCSYPFGYSRYSSFTLKPSARTMRRCLSTISSPAPSSDPHMFIASTTSQMSFSALWISLIICYRYVPWFCLQLCGTAHVKLTIK